jgi:Protein of unknown function (DUF2628)
MSVYTVHEPPLRAVDAAPDPERFVFVRDGFSVWAFLFSVLWMLWYRLWLVLLIYVIVAAGLEAGLRAAGIPGPLLGLVGLLLSLLVGIESATLRRFKLARSGWKNVGVVSGDDLEGAEQRFFDAWLRAAPPRLVVPPPTAPGPAPSPPPSMPQPPDVIGLFPEPGASR